MALQLPQQPAGVNLPAQPQNPPTLPDVVAAGVDVAIASDAPTTAVTDDAEDVAPAWFVPAMTAALAPIRIMLAQIQNYELYDGGFNPFTIVPFNDGSMPTEAPHNLPPLVNVAAIRTLNAAQTIAYAAGYGLGKIRTAHARRVAIARAVGCTIAI